MPEIRLAQLTDYTQVRRLWNLYHPAAVFSEYDFQAELPSYSVALVDGTVVGFCCGHHASAAWLECRVSPRPPVDWDCSYLETLVVDEPHRGRGIGTALLEDLTTRATAAGTSWLLLYPKRGDGRPMASEQLLRFYTRAGLRLLEPADDYLRERPWMMGRPLVASPAYIMARSPAELVPAA